METCNYEHIPSFGMRMHICMMGGQGASNYQRTLSVNAFSDNLTKQREDVSSLKPAAATTEHHCVGTPSRAQNF